MRVSGTAAGLLVWRWFAAHHSIGMPPDAQDTNEDAKEEAPVFQRLFDFFGLRQII